MDLVVTGNLLGRPGLGRRQNKGFKRSPSNKTGGGHRLQAAQGDWCTRPGKEQESTARMKVDVGEMRE